MNSTQYLLLGFFVLLFQTVFCQSYLPIPTQNAEWLEYRKFEESQPKQTHWCGVYHTSFDGDTLINAFIYQKVNYSEAIYFMSTTGGCNWSAILENNYVTDSIFFRNDSLNKKAYLRFKNDTTEYLFYDFDLSLGDTLHQNRVSPQGTFIVDSISTQIIGGANRKVFYFNNSGGIQLTNFRLIEGIGFTTQFLHLPIHFSTPGNPFLNRANHQSLVKVCENGASNYTNLASIPSNLPLLSSMCGLLTQLDELSAKTTVSIYPNPTLGEVNLEMEEEDVLVDILVVNQLGQKERVSFSKQSNSEYKIDITDLKSGIYVLNFISRSGSVASERIVKY